MIVHSYVKLPFGRHQVSGATLLNLVFFSGKGTCLYTCIYTCVDIYIYMYECIYMYVRMYVYVYICVFSIKNRNHPTHLGISHADGLFSLNPHAWRLQPKSWDSHSISWRHKTSGEDLVKSQSQAPTCVWSGRSTVCIMCVCVNIIYVM